MYRTPDYKKNNRKSGNDILIREVFVAKAMSATLSYLDLRLVQPIFHIRATQLAKGGVIALYGAVRHPRRHYKDGERVARACGASSKPNLVPRDSSVAPQDAICFRQALARV